MAEFNYGINIPQPNTGMFGGNLIQGLSAIEGLRAAQAQREQAALLAPYQLQEAQLAIKAREQQMAQSAAAAARAARGEARAEDAYRMQLKAAESEIARREKVATVMNEFATNENAGADVLGDIIGLTNENERKALTDAARIRTGRLFKKMDPNNPDPQSVQQIAELNALLPVEEAKRFDNILAAMPNKYRDGVVNTIVEASMFGLAKDNERAFGVLNDQIEALNKDPNPVSKRMAKELEEVVKRLPEDATPAIWANIGYMNQSKTDQKKAEGYLNFLKERAPESLAEKEAGTAAKMAQANREQATGNLPVAAMKIVETATSQYEKMQELSNKASMLSEKLSQIERPTGKLGEIKNLFSVLLGNEKDVASFTRELKQLGNQQALTEWASVAKGSMSDRDVRVALSTVPSPFGSKEILQDYLTSLSNASKRAAEFQGAKADWVSKFAGNGAAKFDTEIGGVSVTKGQTLREFQDKLAKNILGKQDSTEVGTDPFSRAAEYLRKGGK